MKQFIVAFVVTVEDEVVEHMESKNIDIKEEIASHAKIAIASSGMVTYTYALDSVTEIGGESGACNI